MVAPQIGSADINVWSHRMPSLTRHDFCNGEPVIRRRRRWERAMPNPDALESEDKDLPLREDIRLLGRILGDTVREQKATRRFDTVERIRQTSIRFRRDEDGAARASSERCWTAAARRGAARSSAPSASSRTSPISPKTSTTSAAPAPMPSRQLARRAKARWRMRSSAPARPASPAAHSAPFFADAMVAPVLTAHPTEVRRKSTIDREMEVAELLAERDRIRSTAEELAANETALRRAVLTLWQTSLLRRTRLRVIDEVANGLAYYDYTFLARAAAFLRRSGRRAGRRRGRRCRRRPAVLSAHGQLDRRRPRRQPVRHRGGAARGAAAAERAGARTSISTSCTARRRAVARQPAGRCFAIARATSPRARPTARPTARTSPIAARSPASMRGSPRRRGRSTSARAAAARRSAAPALRRQRRVAGRSRRHRQLADRQRLGGAGTAAGCSALRRAVDVFGFHLAAIDLRQNSDVHERVVGELLSRVQPGPIIASRRGPSASRCCCAELATPRPLASPFSPIRPRPQASWRSCAPPPRRIAATARPRCRIT